MMGCADKERFSSAKKAAKIRDRITARGSSYRRLSMYRCPVCRGWHLTSHPREQA